MDYKIFDIRESNGEKDTMWIIQNEGIGCHVCGKTEIPVFGIDCCEEESRNICQNCIDVSFTQFQLSHMKNDPDLTIITGGNDFSFLEEEE